MVNARLKELPVNLVIDKTLSFEIFEDMVASACFPAAVLGVWDCDQFQ